MKSLVPLLLSALAVFAPLHAVLLTVLVLTLADFGVGVWAASKRGEHITSNGFRRTLVKLAVYELALCMGFLAETYLLPGALPVAKLIGSLVGLTELKSILENLNTIAGGGLFSSILDKLNGPPKAGP